MRTIPRSTWALALLFVSLLTTLGLLALAERHTSIASLHTVVLHELIADGNGSWGFASGNATPLPGTLGLVLLLGALATVGGILAQRLLIPVLQRAHNKRS